MYNRYNIYRNMDFAKKIATETDGVFVDRTFKDDFGEYWIVMWRNDNV